MKQDYFEINELLLDVISEFYEKDKKVRSFGTNAELYHSEIHMLQCIQENPGLHISGIARVMGITRGAASQTVKRLERKGMLTKRDCPENCKKTVLLLTERGETACLYHKREHEKYREILSSVLVSAREDQLEFLTGFLQKFRRSMNHETEELAADPNEGTKLKGSI